MKAPEINLHLGEDGRLGIYTTATEGYTHALKAQARRVQRALSHASIPSRQVTVFLATDKKGTMQDVADFYSFLLPDTDIVVLSDEDLDSSHADYNNACQLVIARMRSIATDAALAAGCDFLLSMDSDVLPPSNAISCMLDTLAFDRGYYGVAACPYPSQGGGAFLGGRGTKQRPILPCFYPDEREIPDEVTKEMEALQAMDLAEMTEDERREHFTKIHDIEKSLDQYPPKDNVFNLNGKKWRRRGWLDNAYPAMGIGATVPTDWCGFGMTMMNRRAAELCDWSGYDGGGTEDLYINFHRWEPNGVRIATIMHCPCDHVVRDRVDRNKKIHIVVGHELEGEFKGHLRQQHRPWYGQFSGEKYSKENDGIMGRPKIPEK